MDFSETQIYGLKAEYCNELIHEDINRLVNSKNEDMVGFN